MRKLFIFMGLILSLSINAIELHDQLDVHILKEGETLSELLWDEGFQPLYGKTNWVHKTLQMNRLTAEEAKKLQKGYPVILPTKRNEKLLATPTQQTVTTPVISTHQENGLFTRLPKNTFNLAFEFGYFYQNQNLKSEEVEIKENFNLALNIKKITPYSLSKNINFRPSTTLAYNSQNTISFKNIDNIEANFSPTYKLSLGGDFLPRNSSYTYQSFINTKSISRLHEPTKETYMLRKDMSIDITVGVQYNNENSLANFSFGPYIGKSIYSSTTDDVEKEDYYLYGINSSVALTSNSNLKAYLEKNIFKESEELDLMGINFEYLID